MDDLRPTALERLPLATIRPTGWLQRQLRIQADGMTGHLDQFWPDVKDSAWFGGDAEGWERAPYWLDGFLPLAYLLDDAGMKERAQHYFDHIITHQQPDGWLGPVESNSANVESKGRYDIWAQFLATKILVEYHGATGDERVPGVVEQALRKIDSVINWTPLFDWGQARWFEALIAIHWLYEQLGPDADREWLLDLVVKLEAQGFGWKGFLRNWPMTDPTPKWGWNFMGHVVNNAMAIKAYALLWRTTGDPDDRAAVDDMIGQLQEHHGTALGHFTGDECIAGREPTHGTELCACVEYMYSLEHVISVWGDPSYADRLESLAFNALPAYFTRDMWAHQYDQQVNQVECSINPAMPWNTNLPDANIYGLEPHFGCCTANYHQGFPKFAAHSVMRDSASGGLAIVSPVPVEVNTEVHGVPVTLTVGGDYPFSDTVVITVTTPEPVRFPLRLRMPNWSAGTTVTVGGADQPARPGGFHDIDREWQGTSVVVVDFAPLLFTDERLRGAVAVHRGPLMFALPIAERREIVNTDKPHREFPHCDYAMYAESEWRYALDIDTAHFNGFTPTAQIPFSDTEPPATLTVQAAPLPEWTFEECFAGPTPPSPVTTPSAAVRELRLVPFGCTHLRIGEFPNY